MHKLQIFVQKAILTRCTQIGSLMDPYAQIRIGQQIQRTQILKQKGDMPQWNQTIEFVSTHPLQQQVIQIKVKDKDNVSSDLVGQVYINLKEQKNKIQTLNWYSLKYKTKPAGKIMLKIHFSNYNFGYSTSLNQNQNQNSTFISNNKNKSSIEFFQPSVRQNSNSLLKQKDINKNQSSQVFYTGKKGINRHNSLKKYNNSLNSNLYPTSGQSSSFNRTGARNGLTHGQFIKLKELPNLNSNITVFSSGRNKNLNSSLKFVNKN